MCDFLKFLTMTRLPFRCLPAALILLMIAGPLQLFSQNIGVNGTGANPDASAMLHVEADKKGLIIPRVTLDDTSNAAPVTAVTPAEGLMIYNQTGTEPKGYYYWNAGKGQWLQVGSGATDDDWDRDAGNAYLFPSNLGDRVGVGTNTPNKARFEVQGASEERVGHFEADFDKPSSGIVRTALFKNNGHTGVAKFRAVQAASLGNDGSDGRSTGVFGKAGGRDHNIAVFGQLNSSSEDGTGIFGSVGSISASSTGDLQANSYAGYFQGDVALTAALEDNNGATGTAGEVLTSTGTGLEWQAAGGGSDNDWDRDAGNGYLYPSTISDQVGVGTNNPTKAQLQVDPASNTRGVHIEGDFDNMSSINRTLLSKNNGHNSGAAKYRAIQGASLGNDQTSGRTHGVFGKAGGRDINVAIYGKLPSGKGTGAGVYGTTGGSNLDLQSDRYAGYFNGDLAYTGALKTPSDRRLKKEIEANSGLLGSLMKLKTYTYRFEDHEFMEFGDGIQYGFIAQEVESVFPNLVAQGAASGAGPLEGKKAEDKKKEGYRKLKLVQFLPITVQAIKDQQRIIEKQEERIEELEKELEKKDQKLEKRIRALESKVAAD